MAKGQTVVEIKNGKRSLDLYVKAPFVEKYFKKMSKDTYGEIKTRSCCTPDGETLYTYYLLKNLPSTPFSLQATNDMFNAFGFLRGKGIARGLRIQLNMPLTYEMAKDMVDRVTENIRHIYSLYCDEYTVRRCLTVEEGDEDAEVSTDSEENRS
jgi:hypothetical protein